MKRLLLIDAYAMIYRAYYAFIKNPRITSAGRNTSAIYGFVIMLEDLLKRLEPTHIGVAFDPKGKTFRHEAYEQYKAQRPDTPEDIHAAVPDIKQILQAMNIAVLEVAGYEADDVIGTLSKQAQAAGFEVFMATPDKDYGQLVGENVYMYRPRHTGGFEQMGVKEVCEKYGIERTEQVIDLLGLMGDASDNIPGCTGVGEKTAVKLLQEFGSIENLLQHTDQLKGALRGKVESQVEQIQFSKFLATIKTDVPITLDEQLLERKAVNVAALRAVYTGLEFRSLLRKYEGAEPATVVPSQPQGALDLFSTVEETAQEIQTLEVEQIDCLPAINGQVAVYVTEGEKAAEAVDLFTTVEKTPLRVIVAAGKQYTETTLNKEVRALLESEDILKIGYDVKHTLKLLRREGIAQKGRWFDVEIAHYLVQPEQRHEVDYLSEIYLRRTCEKEAVQMTVAAYQLVEPLRKELERVGAVELFDTMEMPLIPVLAAMEQAGVRFDVGVLREASKKLTKEMNELEREVVQLARVDFNVNSPRQVGEVLFERLGLDEKAKKTKGGQYVTSEEVLQQLQDKHPVVGKILEYRAVKKLLSTYIDALPQLINPQTGKVHTDYNQTVTATGRLSSSNPNLQNLPIRSERGKEIRRAVIADAGCVFLSADYSQIELRLMAHFSGDEHLIHAFQTGQDIHAATAAKIFGCDIEQVTRDMRRKAKTANFGIIYGISAFGLAQQLQSSRSEAKQLIDDYFRSFPKVIDFIERAKQQAREKGYTETLFHRRRYLPDILSRNPTVRSFAERNAVNAPIQGTAADIIKIAMVRIYNRLQQEGLRAEMIMQVHDELNFNVPVAEQEQVRRIVKEEMEQVIKLQVPLTVECQVGQNWLEAH